MNWTQATREHAREDLLDGNDRRVQSCFAVRIREACRAYGQIFIDDWLHQERVYARRVGLLHACISTQRIGNPMNVDYNSMGDEVERRSEVRPITGGFRPYHVHTTVIS